jgi:hypothetical protein
MIGESQALSMLKRSAFLLLTSLFFATPAWKAAHAAEPAQDEALAYAAGVQAYINWGKGAGFISHDCARRAAPQRRQLKTGQRA